MFSYSQFFGVRLRAFFLAGLLIFTFSGCNKTDTLPDSRFIGDWWYFYHWEDASGIEEITESIRYIFEDDVLYYSRRYSEYRTSSGWTNNDFDFTYDWKVEGNELYTKLQDNDFSDWSSRSIEYISSDSIVIEGVGFAPF